jgi:hypothetical protein
LVEHLIGNPVSNPGKKPLIEKHGLDRRLSLGQRG